MSCREYLTVAIPAAMTQAKVDRMMEAAGFTLVASYMGGEPGYLAFPGDEEDTVRCLRPLVFCGAEGEWFIQTASLNRGQVPGTVAAFFEKAFEGGSFTWIRDYQAEPMAEGILGLTALPETRL